MTPSLSLSSCSGERVGDSSSISKKSDSAVSSPKSNKSGGSLRSPKEAIQAPQDSDNFNPPEESKVIPSLPDSPATETDTEPDFTKMGVYSPTQEQFSMPENIATEAQTNTSLPTAASDVQGAKCYFSDSEYSVSSNSEVAGSFYSPSAVRGYSYNTQSSISPSPLMSPSTYPTAYNSSFGHSAESMVASGGMYPSACMSPSYMSPYGTTKQYTWPTPANGVNYGAYSPELMQSGYAYQQSAFQQMAMGRTSYPAGYFHQIASTTTTAS